jgi:hypothetical protein
VIIATDFGSGATTLYITCVTMNSESDFNDALLRARATERCRWDKSYKRTWAYTPSDHFTVWNKQWLPDKIAELRKAYPEEATVEASATCANSSCGEASDTAFIYKHIHARYHVRGSLALGTDINEVVGVYTSAYLPYMPDSDLWSTCHSILYSLLLLEVPHIMQHECLTISFCNTPVIK